MNKKKILILATRLLLGAIFLAFGMDGFLKIIPVGPSTSPAALFLGAIMGTGYLWQVVKVIEIICGLLLLSNRFVPLALVLIAPIILNITGYLVILNQSGQPMAVLLLILEIFLAYSYRDSFKSVLQAKVILEES